MFDFIVHRVNAARLTRLTSSLPLNKNRGEKPSQKRKAQIGERRVASIQRRINLTPMPCSLTLVAKATGVAVVCLIAYRGFQLYCKNDITIYVTEVVHLPEMAVQSHRRRRPQIDSDLILSIEGKVEMETCLMSSYRFLLKLVGHVRAELPDSGKSSSLPSTMGLRSTRHRVLSLQAGGTYNSFRDDDSVSDASFTSNRKHGPALTITAVDPMVDAYEAENSGLLAFTPACIGEGLLCRYTCTARNATGDGASSSAQGSTLESANSVAPSPSTPCTVLQGNDNGLGSIYVRSCFLESDGATAYCQRLTMEIEFLRPVFGAGVVIRLPSKHCRIQRSSTGGVGTVTQLMHQPRKCVWDIGEVAEAMCIVSPDDETGGSGGGAGSSMEGLMPDAGAPAVNVSHARLELVFEQPPPGISFGEEEDACQSGDSDDDDENRFGSTVSSVKSNSTKRCTRSTASGARWLGSTSLGSPSSTAGAVSSGRSRKRKERALMRRSRNNAGTRFSGGANSDGMPYVEVVFSVNQLLSGTAVRKLQVLQETPNWTPRSALDRLILHRFIPSLAKMRLRKLAHYTTWFVQPVLVSQL
ncbi:hypothetical protein ABL78_0939 [Leptomonas seymouri]|uniref:Uncharacterized protein n=1 Tax=Leptomonas seymouri TaxID=5684 RepID=A0A0N1IMJ2_LEPSE|nr:hypothetical protein ABL78_0939 [Leptomonas seymouri]|eukprot:KPI89971.1 hypothetical protein ABL78_0939 [Leptomonas seymouri]